MQILNPDPHFAWAAQVYEVLSVLQCTSVKAQQALQAGARLSEAESENFDRYFQRVGQGCVSHGCNNQCEGWG